MHPKQFLSWIKNRLFLVYNEQPETIAQLETLINNYSFINKNISSEKIDNICRKYYADFDMDKCELNLGYSEAERNQLRDFIRNIIEESKCAT